MRLVKKEKIEQDGLRYWDLSIPGTHNYILSNGVIVHNCGTGVGFSVERTFVNNLPVVAFPTENIPITHIIEDSTEGWADALYVAMTEAHRGNRVHFDYSQIREKGARLKTKGGRASGPMPLRKVFNFIRDTVGKAAGRCLRPIECHDIVCMEAEIVMVGGFRRASLISFSDLDDLEMRQAKDFTKGDVPKIRYMANNSVYYEGRPTEEQFWTEWDSLAKSGSGERGFYIASDSSIKKRGGHKFRCNPCGEIKLRFRRALDPWTGAGGAGQFCNLTAAVMRANDTIQTMARKIRLATWLGCVQSTYTHFPYLRSGWTELCNEDQLIGVDITGQCDNPKLSNNPTAMLYFNQVARETAKIASDTLGINYPAAITCGKPSGNCRPWYALTTTNVGLLTLQDLFEHHPNGQDWAPLQQDIHAIRPGEDAQKILRTYDNGESPLVRLNLLYGLSVEATPNHKWFVKYRVGPGRKTTDVHDWVPAKDIRPGDVLEVKLGTYTREDHAKLSTFNSRAWHMATSAKPIRTPGELNEDMCWFLGYLWGDGAMSPGGFRFRFTDEHVWNLTKVQRVLMDQFGLESTLANPKGRKDYTLDFASVHLWHWLLENGVFKYNAEGGVDIIPRVVRSSSRDDIIAFMAGMLDSDGWAGYKRQGLGSFTFTTASSLLARHLQDVAWAVGLGVGRSLNSLGSSFQTRREMYLLGCSSQVDPGAFDVLLRNSNKVQRVAEGGRFKDWEWRQAKREYHVGRVVSVEETLPVPTFDIEVDADHWYYAGSVKSHNSSQFLDCASGFHPRYSKYYFRHVRISSKDPLYHLIKAQGVPLYKENNQEHLPDDQVDVWVARFPVKAPEGGMTRNDETAIQECERYLHVMRTWCGELGHNQSATIYVNDDEWGIVGKWVWEHFDEITGLTFMPHDPSAYRLAPYVEITAEEYEQALFEMPKIDFSLLSQYEAEDNTEGAQSYACVSGACEL